MADDLASAIRASSGRLGIDPLDFATAISYETAGTFDPWKAGPRTQWGQHRGLIQWGEPQRQKYGVYQGMSNADQLRAAERYLIDAGVKPGMGLLDVYSAINAGRVGRYGASDANNGGAPGTVADKVNNQMAGHRAKAAALLGGEIMAAATKPAAGTSLASFYGAPGATTSMANPDPLAAAGTQQPAFGSLALLFAQQQAAQQQRRADERAAEEARRAALFAPDSLANLFG